MDEKATGMPRASARPVSKRIRGIARLRASRLCDTRQHRSGSAKSRRAEEMPND